MPLPEPPTPCAECGGERLPAQAAAYSDLLPEHSSLIERFTSRIPLQALVCTQCGLVTWYARATPHTKEPKERA